jgi:hypothetical protein
MRHPVARKPMHVRSRLEWTALKIGWSESGIGFADVHREYLDWSKSLPIDVDSV